MRIPNRGAWLACGLALAGCALPPPPAPERPAAAHAGTLSIPIEVMKPDGAGPFPAIVMLHDCSGLGARSSGAPRRWGRELVAEGYVVVIPDSFSTRGHGDGVCTTPYQSRTGVAPVQRVADAYTALARARSLPYVDGARVGVMGGSHGGSTTLQTLVGGTGFKAGVALYPGCNATIGDWHPGTGGVYKPSAPLLILTGELDDWTPAEPCRQLIERSKAAGYEVAIKVYPGARHSFDSRAPLRYNPDRVNSNALWGRGATTEGNAEAWADSIKVVKAYFAKQLR